MRPGISRVVVEIIILVVAVALALLIFSPISGYIFGSLGRTATVGGATTAQIISASYDSGSGTLNIYIKNLGPNSVNCTTGNQSFQVYVDSKYYSSTGNSNHVLWSPGKIIVVQATVSPFDVNTQHNIVVYGPGGVQVQYLYSPS
jgi:hypothetical protein